MAPRSLLLSFLLAPISIRALQVTPNSPCASACQDSDALDTSDPNSSNTKNSDITCPDASYEGSTAGIKWKNCMTCLQNSTFAQGSENDQMWFLYNSRYAISYCVVGFPNATDVGSSPCMTSTACEPLQASLEDGILAPQDSTQYGYCSVNGSAMTHSTYSNCLECIGTTGETQFLSNYLVALQAGCLQQPAPGKVVGLSDSVFSSTIISIVDPSTVTDTPKSESSGLPTTTIAIIVICIVVGIALVAALLFIRRRKRKNRIARASAEHYRQWAPQSPLSFQCQTNPGPKTPKFFRDASSPVADGMSHAPSPTGHPQATMWNQHHPVSSFQNFSAISKPEKEKEAQQAYSQVKGGLTSPQRPNHNPNVSLHTLDTSALPAAPAFTYHSPSSAVLRHSPSDTYTTPTSTTSTRSTTQLLPKHSVPGPYSPADVVSPVSAGANGIPPSPLTWRPAWASGDGGPPALPPKSPRAMNTSGGGARKVKRGKRESGSPVESRRVDTVFPPPPTGR